MNKMHFFVIAVLFRISQEHVAVTQKISASHTKIHGSDFKNVTANWKIESQDFNTVLGSNKWATTSLIGNTNGCKTTRKGTEYIGTIARGQGRPKMCRTKKQWYPCIKWSDKALENERSMYGITDCYFHVELSLFIFRVIYI